MGKTCLICSHPKRLEMEREYIQGVGRSEISRKYDIQYESIRKHMDSHLPRQLVQAWERKFGFEYNGILENIEELIVRTKRILDKAETGDKNYLALKAIREARSGYDLLQRIAFSLHEAKCRELETEHLKQSFERANKTQLAADQLDVLTEEELKFLMRVQTKLKTQNEKLSAIPKRLHTDEIVFKELREFEVNNNEFVGSDYYDDEEEDNEIRVRPIVDDHPEAPKNLRASTRRRTRF